MTVLAVFGQTIVYDFVNYDDGQYVTDNPHVQQGVGVSSIYWAFTNRDCSNWHPLTWLSHILDYQLYGLRAGGHHLTNVLLHAAGAILLFLVLWRMTGNLWPSAFVAAVFAVHPLHVESVAWVSERKDVLSGLFFMLTLAAYLRYVRGGFSSVWYWTVAALFALGLMAKPMLVTLPLVLLLLDYWPLERRQALRWLFVEKIPLFALSAASCAMTLWAERDAIAAAEGILLPWRIGHAVVAYAAYLVQSVYPANLAVLYPHSGNSLPMWKIAAALLVLASATAVVFYRRRRNPYLLVGWLWYLVMLAPVIGLVQVGVQTRADRYTYLPQIGLCIALAWWAADVVRAWPACRWALGAASTLAVAVLAVVAARQTTHWRNSEALWTHALACTEGNSVAHCCLGLDLENRGRIQEAVAEYGRSLKTNPANIKAHNNLGVVLMNQGRFDEAIQHYREAIRLRSDRAEPYCNLGRALALMGQTDAAVAEYQKALKLKPDFADAHNGLGLILTNCGRFDEAIAQCREALALKPGWAEAHYNLGMALARRGEIVAATAQFQIAVKIKRDYAEAYIGLGNVLTGQQRCDEAIAQYRKALKLKPELAEAHFNLGVTLTGRGRLDEAMPEFEEVVKLVERVPQSAGGQAARMLDAIATVYAEAGRFTDAAATAGKALKIAERWRQQALADELRAKIADYQEGKLHRPKPQPAL